MMRLALAVPCHNESARLTPEVWLEFLAHPENKDVHFFFANDGSSDDTGKVLRDMCAQSSRAHLFESAVRRGKAETVRRSTLRIAGRSAERQYGGPFDYVGFWDADLATPLSEIEEIRRLLTDRAFDGVFCSRIKRLGATIDRKPLRHILGRMFATTASAMLQLPVYDTQCGAKVFRSGAVEPIMRDRFVSEWIFDLEIILRMKRRGFDGLYEKPVSGWSDVPGSKIKPMDYIRIPLDLLKIQRRYC